MQDAIACNQRCRRAAAVAHGRMLGRMMHLFLRRDPLPRLVGHLVHPAEALKGLRAPCATQPKGCLTARLLRNDGTWSPAPLDPVVATPADDVAWLVLDPAPDPALYVGLWTAAEAAADGPARRFLAPGPDGTVVTTATAPFPWYLGLDERSGVNTNRPVEWYQFYTDADPERASVLAVGDDGGAALRVVPLTMPVPSIPILELRQAPKAAP